MRRKITLIFFSIVTFLVALIAISSFGTVQKAAAATTDPATTTVTPVDATKTPPVSSTAVSSTSNSVKTEPAAGTTTDLASKTDSTTTNTTTNSVTNTTVTPTTNSAQKADSATVALASTASTSATELAGTIPATSATAATNTPTTKAVIPITGNTAADAKVTNSDGSFVSPNQDLWTWQIFDAGYDWAIHDGVKIKDGDTADFTLPGNVIAKNTISFPIFDDTGAVIGTFNIQKGATTGTLTFNDVLGNSNNRHGKLYFKVRGSQIDTSKPGPFIINKNGWILDQKEARTTGPTELAWNIAANSEKKKLTNVVITDIIPEGLTYKPGSVWVGADNGTYAITPDKVTVEGQKITFYFAKLDTDIDLRYTTTLDEAVDPSKISKWTNHATISADGIPTTDSSHTIEYGGGGNGVGDPVGSVILTKTDADTGKALPGATFELMDSTGKVLQQNLVTDENGNIVIGDLTPGDYVLVETSVPMGYEPTANFEHPFTVVANKDTEIPATDNPIRPALPGSLIVMKVDSSTKEPLEGAVYQILDAYGNLVEDNLTTNDQGIITVAQIPDGSYTLVEKTAPKDYLPNTTPIDFDVIGGQVTNLIVTDTKDPSVVIPTENGTLKIYKQDAETGAPLFGAYFYIMDTDGNVIVENLQSDENGEVVVPDLPDGNYILREVTPPYGYNDNENYYPFTIKNGEVTTVTVDDIENPTLGPLFPGKGGISLVKLSKESKVGVPNAEFDLLDIDGIPYFEGLKTDANGMLTIPLVPEGEYTLVETKAPEGYELLTEPIKVTVSNSEVTNVEVDDPELPHDGSLSIIKVDSATKSPVAGAVFEIRDANGEVVESNLTTDEFGKINIPAIPEGDYTLVETKAPEGYELNSTPIKFTAVWGQDVTIDATDTKLPTDGSLTILKVDSATKTPLFGADFQILDSTGKVVEDNLITDDKGQITISALPDGSYTLVKKLAPQGYEDNKTPIPFTIVAGKVTDLEVPDTAFPPEGSLKVVKVDAATKAPLAGAVFKVVDSTGTTVKDGLTTDEKGEILIDALPDGKYTLIETTAPVGYEENQQPLEFTVSSGQVTSVDVSDIALPTDGSLLVLKVDSVSKKPLSGATFQILDSTGKVVKDNLTTDEKGQLAIDALPDGSYTLVETSAPVGYEDNKAPLEFTITAGKATDLTVADTELPTDGSLLVLKVDSTSKKPLSGATFQILDSTGKVVKDNLTTDEKGQLAIDALPDGTYTLVETSAPEGYEDNKAPLEFTITAGKATDLTVSDTELPTDGSLVVLKVDSSTKKPLAGAVFSILDSNNKVVKENLTTDENGQLTIDALPDGSYTLVETTAPDGYVDKAPVSFNIVAGKATNVEVDDVLAPTEGALLVLKVDSSTKKPLADAVFSIYDSTGKEVKAGLTTNEKGEIEIDALPDGNYTLVETTAPNGYDDNKDPISFTISADKLTNLEVPDTETVPPVSEGSLIVLKVDSSTKKPLANAVFSILDSTGKEVKTGLTTNAKGEIEIDALPDGSYTLVETTAPSGYDENKTPIPFAIKNGEVTNLEVSDTQTPEPPVIVEPVVPPTNPEPEVPEPEKPGLVTPTPGPTKPSVTVPSTPVDNKPSTPAKKPGNGTGLPQTGNKSENGLAIVAAILLSILIVIKMYFWKEKKHLN